ncbi:hypothetical protein ABH948_005434 [Bacillus sp. RC218]|uniref:hypothetical protein n=1 Tax=Bacillus TaxID=1386 RepID=UPI0019148301|nr:MULTISPECIES: hypothetical protein [Bacillus]MBK5503054.1 hypothetical protein [Bacillus sp. TH12]MBK5515317.1 hypothetical protein [Bacillus sp. TH11]QWG42578.1 hypothetical protein EXW35_30390 [Bacillus mycoides]QWI77942.1 hypothetical protein JG486_27730 [Bacillus mycoides]
MIREGGIYIDSTEVLLITLGKKLFSKLIRNIDEITSKTIRKFIQRTDFSSVPPKPGIMKPTWKETFKYIRKTNPTIARKQVESFMDNTRKQVHQDMNLLQGEESLEKKQYHLDTIGIEIIRNIIPKLLAFMISSVFLKKLLSSG